MEFGGGVGGNSYVVCLAILIAGAQLEGLFFDLGYAHGHGAGDDFAESWNVYY